MTPFVHHNVQAAAKKEASEKAKARAAAKKKSQTEDQPPNDDASVVGVKNIAEATLERSRTVKEAQEEATKARDAIDLQHKLTEDEEVRLHFRPRLTH